LDEYTPTRAIDNDNNDVFQCWKHRVVPANVSRVAKTFASLEASRRSILRN